MCRGCRRRCGRCGRGLGGGDGRKTFVLDRQPEPVSAGIAGDGANGCVIMAGAEGDDTVVAFLLLPFFCLESVSP